MGTIIKHDKVNRNVLFLLGCPCAGKTTIAKLLTQRNNIYCLSGDERRFDFYKQADPSKHKYMTMDTSDFWQWSLDKMVDWERGVISEQTPMIIEELNRLSEVHDFVLFEGMIDIEYLLSVADRYRIVYLTVDRDVCETDFFGRDDHNGMKSAILRTEGISDEEKKRRIEIRKEAAITAFYEDAQSLGLQCFSRLDISSPLNMVEQIEQYFGLICPKNLKENDIQHRLAEFIGKEIEYWDFWGAIRIVKNGKTLWETSRGFSCAEFGVKNTMSTRFTIASVTKQFTAFAVMLLYDKGLLSLDADANTYLPEDMQIPAGITVHNLLSHTSGLYNFYNFEDDFYIGEDRLPYDRKAFLSKCILKQPVSTPGESFNYNNSNYNLLAWIIEHVSKQSYADFLSENIFLPLGMLNTTFDDGLAVQGNKANNYMHDYGETVRVPYVNNLFLMGAGALVSNCDDLQKWYECLKDRKLLSAKAYKRFFTENMNHYCYGLEHHERNGVTMYAHGGDANGIATYTQYFFEDDLCIIILSNNESLNQYRLGTGIAEILYGIEPKHASRPDEVPVSEEHLQKFTGTYLPGKIHIEVKNGKLYLVRVNQNIHIELYCIGPNTFVRRHEEQSYTHNLLPEGSEKPVVWGYELIRKDFV